MKAIHEHPGKRAHEEVMQQDGNNRTQELVGAGKRIISKENKNKEVEKKGSKGKQGEARWGEKVEIHIK